MRNFSDTQTGCCNKKPCDGWYRQQDRLALDVSDSRLVIGAELVTGKLQSSSKYLDLQQLTNGGRVLKTRTE